jgi:hypothetical protein
MSKHSSSGKMFSMHSISWNYATPRGSRVFHFRRRFQQQNYRDRISFVADDSYLLRLRSGNCRRHFDLSVSASGNNSEPSTPTQQGNKDGNGSDSYNSSNNSVLKGTSSTLKDEAKRNNVEMYDKLVNVFVSRPAKEWRKLIVHSKQWPHLSAHVIARMEERAKALADLDDEENQRTARELRQTARRLQMVSDEIKQFADLVSLFRESPSRDWESLVANYRNSLGADFFGYLDIRIQAAVSQSQSQSQSDIDANQSKEAESLAALATQLAALVEAYDSILANESALEAAEANFLKLLESTSLEAAEATLDEYAASGRLDPALLLTMAKAYAGVKETDVTREEVKDIMAHLYFKAKETYAQQAPPEARILKFLLSVESPKDRAMLVEQAFQAGPLLSTSSEDYLHTTPSALINTIENVLGAYDSAGQAAQYSSMKDQAAVLMNPEVIERLRELQKLIRSKYM